MSLTHTEREGLEVAGFALAEGVERASRATPLGTTLVVRGEKAMQCVPLQPDVDPLTHVTVLMHALGGSVGAAALLEEQEWGGQRTIQVTVWVDGEWRYQLALPFRAGSPLRVSPERIWGGLVRRRDVRIALDAVYSGVSCHPEGLKAWAAAVVEV